MSNNKQVARVIQILQMINTEPYQYDPGKLADHFHINKRTLYRDIQLLRDLDYYVEYDPDRLGYYIMHNATPWPPERLTEAEKQAMEISEKLLMFQENLQNNSELRKHYHTAISKLMTKMGYAKTETSVIDRLSDRILLGATISKTGDGSAILELYTAIQERSSVEMLYESYSSYQITTRKFDPYYIVPRHNNLYAIGFCHVHQDFRVFRVSRMHSVRCLHQPFTEDPDFSIDQMISQSFGIDQNGPLIIAKVRFSKNLVRYVKENIDNINSIVGETELEDGMVELQINAHLTVEFLRWVLQYGADIDVIGTEILVEAIKKQVSSLADRYLLQDK